MDSIYRMIGTLCICGYITGLLMNFTTTNHTQKAIRLTAALYIITAIMAPVENFDFDIETENLTDITFLQKQSEDFVISAAATEIEKEIAERFTEKNISYKAVSVHIHKQNENLSVEQIDIKGIRNSDKQLIYSLLEDIAEQDKIIFGE